MYSGNAILEMLVFTTGSYSDKEIALVLDDLIFLLGLFRPRRSSSWLLLPSPPAFATLCTLVRLLHPVLRQGLSGRVTRPKQRVDVTYLQWLMAQSVMLETAVFR